MLCDDRVNCRANVVVKHGFIKPKRRVQRRWDVLSLFRGDMKPAFGLHSGGRWR